MNMEVETYGQYIRDLWTREWRLVDKGMETCGHADNETETCEQEHGDFWTREWRLLDERAETSGEKSKDLW